jgi:hypothetical protein
LETLYKDFQWKSSYAIASTESSNARAPAEISMEELLQGYIQWDNGRVLRNNARTFAEISMEELLQGHPMGQWKQSFAIACAESSNARAPAETRRVPMQ